MTAPILYSLAGKRVFVAGHRGMVGSALMRRLASEGCDLITVARGEVDLRRQDAVECWMAANRPQAVFVAAATVGGIYINDARPADFLYDNLAIEANVIEASRQTGVEKLIFLGSSCIYPRNARQPMPESELLTGPLEPTNQWYALAKIAGIMLCRAYRRQHGCDYVSAMPTNLYGPGDNFDLEASHVIPALIAKAHRAKQQGGDIPVWGTGSPLREFMHVDDLADAVVFLMRRYDGEEHVNVGTGQEVSIRELAEQIARTVGVESRLRFEPDKPDGMPRKLLDTGKLRGLGWEPKIGLQEGLRATYAWYVKHLADAAA